MSAPIKSMFSLRIGPKLIVMSAVSVVLLVGLIATQMMGNAAISKSDMAAARLAKLANQPRGRRVRGMQIAVRPSGGEAEFDKAEALDARHQNLTKASESLKLSSTPTNVDRFAVVKASRMYSTAPWVYRYQINIFAPRKTRQRGLEKQIVKINEPAGRIVRERLIPAAEKLEETLDAAVAFFNRRSDEAALSAQRDGVLGTDGLIIRSFRFSSDRLGDFRHFTIARPLQKAGVLGELTSDRIVEVPYAATGQRYRKNDRHLQTVDCREGDQSARSRGWMRSDWRDADKRQLQHHLYGSGAAA